MVRQRKSRAQQDEEFIEEYCKQFKGFEAITRLPPNKVKRLNKARKDLQSSIERTIRIKQAFVRELTPLARISNRVQAVIARVDEVGYLGSVQREIAGPKLTNIITLREVAKERKRKRTEEAVKEAKKKIKANCTHEDLFEEQKEPCPCEQVEVSVHVPSEITDYLSDVSA